MTFQTLLPAIRASVISWNLGNIYSVLSKLSTSFLFLSICKLIIGLSIKIV